jgi:hypothetical protein
MNNAISIHVTIDHGVIRSWAERRGARPSRSDADGRPPPLMFDIGPPKAGVVEIGWEEFLDEFERANLAFVYREGAPDGELDDFHEFVIRSVVPELILSNKATLVERVG